MHFYGNIQNVTQVQASENQLEKKSCTKLKNISMFKKLKVKSYKLFWVSKYIIFVKCITIFFNVEQTLTINYV